jgi:hypothetical protein
MKKDIIIAISAFTAIGVGAILLRNYLKKNGKKANPSKGGRGSASGSRGGSTDDDRDATSVSMSEIKSDAEKIYSALNLWTTDNDEKIIVDRISKYSKSDFVKLEKLFNQEYEFKVGNAIKNYPLREWLEEDLSDENYSKISTIIS